MKTKNRIVRKIKKKISGTPRKSRHYYNSHRESVKVDYENNKSMHIISVKNPLKLIKFNEKTCRRINRLGTSRSPAISVARQKEGT